jgi:hypothetical protein
MEFELRIPDTSQDCEICRLLADLFRPLTEDSFVLVDTVTVEYRKVDASRLLVSVNRSKYELVLYTWPGEWETTHQCSFWQI